MTADGRLAKAGGAAIGVTGLAVMGRNLARNLARHGYPVAVHNRSPERIRSLIDEHGTEGTFVAAESMEDFVASLSKPRAIIVMVKAGEPTDAVIGELVPLLSEGDIVVDCGNAHYMDTRRREAAAATRVPACRSGRLQLLITADVVPAAFRGRRPGTRSADRRDSGLVARRGQSPGDVRPQARGPLRVPGAVRQPGDPDAWSSRR